MDAFETIVNGLMRAMKRNKKEFSIEENRFSKELMDHHQKFHVCYYSYEEFVYLSLCVDSNTYKKFISLYEDDVYLEIKDNCYLSEKEVQDLIKEFYFTDYIDKYNSRIEMVGLQLLSNSSSSSAIKNNMVFLKETKKDFLEFFEDYKDNYSPITEEELRDKKNEYKKDKWSFIEKKNHSIVDACEILTDKNKEELKDNIFCSYNYKLGEVTMVIEQGMNLFKATPLYIEIKEDMGGILESRPYHHGEFKELNDNILYPVFKQGDIIYYASIDDMKESYKEWVNNNITVAYNKTLGYMLNKNSYTNGITFSKSIDWMYTRPTIFQNVLEYTITKIKEMKISSIQFPYEEKDEQ
tara:strand:- start:28 stop:1086 length:1059 start_codon:yes stop_codon:yes gene_type:complete